MEQSAAIRTMTMHYLCAGKPIDNKQIVELTTKSRQKNRSVAKIVVIESCTKREQSEWFNLKPAKFLIFSWSLSVEPVEFLIKPFAKIVNRFSIDFFLIFSMATVPVCKLVLRSYTPSLLEMSQLLVEKTAEAMAIPISLKELPTDRKFWSVLKSPFVNKKHMEQFDRKVFQKQIDVCNTHPKVLEKWLDYLRWNAPAGIGIQATIYDYKSWDEIKQGPI